MPGNLSGGCERIAKWSTPDSALSHCNEPVGIATTNNRDTLELTARTVANFRCGLPTPANVWMKDTWDDTGAEPDPALNNEVMWKSPYIWVRNTQDPGPGFLQQHLHENPVKGETNYAYVKLHNGGTTTSGTLELWRADASTALNWQTNFTRIGSRRAEFPGQHDADPGIALDAYILGSSLSRREMGFNKRPNGSSGNRGHQLECSRQ